jgi:cytochrome P450
MFVDLLGRQYLQFPHEVERWLRDEAPVHQDAGTGLWLISRYDDVRFALTHPDEFLPDNALNALSPLSMGALRTLHRGGFDLPATLANNSTDSHRVLRRLVAPLFTARRVEQMRAATAAWTADALTRVEEALEVDGVADLAAVADFVPPAVMATMLGLQDWDQTEVRRWTDAALMLFWGRPDAEDQAELAEAAVELYQWLVRAIRSGTPEGLVGVMTAYRDEEGRPLDEATCVAVCYFLVIAGQVTTSQLMRTAFRRLLLEPGAWQRISQERDDVPTHVEEVLRLEPPLTTWRRVTSTTIRMHGQDIPAGAPVLLMLASAGSDPRCFEQPHLLQPGRPGARQHLAFGLGVHSCLGAALARMEAEVILAATAAHLPHLELSTEEYDTPPLISFRSPTRVLVRRPEPGGAAEPVATAAGVA